MSFVLSYLDPHDLLTVSLVSRAWRDRVTDSNLWKNKFSVEGWGLDTAEIARLEKTFQRPVSPNKDRKSAQYTPGQTSPGTFRWSNHSAIGHVLSSTSPDGATGTTTLPAIDQEMMDVDDDHFADDRLRQGRLSFGHSPEEMQITPPHSLDTQSHHTRFRKPLVITSPPGYSRINYHYIFKQKRRLEDNWDKGCYKNFQLPHRNAPHEAHEECVYTIQYQGNYLVSGSRDRTLRIWNLTTGRLVRKPLKGHSGSVLCLQFDSRSEEDIIISGSSDTNVILWRFSTGEMIKKIAEAHSESVLNLRFDHRFLVTCSKDKTIKIWNRHQLHPGDADYPRKGLLGGGECPAYIIDDPSTSGSVRYQPSNELHLMELDPYVHLMTLSLHGAAVNAIQIYKDQLVSASGDRNLRVWNIHTGQCTSKIPAHEKGIACVQYDGKRIVSGSSDNSIRIWDPATKTEVARLEGHTRLVRTLQAAFTDVPGGREQLEAEAAEIDRQWEIAREYGEDLRPGRATRPARPGSRRPRDLRALGAKIPPSGGGSRWARIVSGSYDEKVIIWKKNAEDEWVVSHQLAQEEALTAAGPPLFTRTQVNGTTHVEDTIPPSLPLPAGPSNAQTLQARHTSAPMNYPLHPPLSLPPPVISSAPALQAAGRSSSPQHVQPSQASNNPSRSLRAFSSAQKGSRSSSLSHLPADPGSTSESSQQASSSAPAPAPAPTPAHANQPPTRPPISNTLANQTQAQTHPRHPVLPALQQHAALPAGQPNARVFKLQFDARRIICCSQDNKIVGWDFANGDEDIIACSRFFADPQ